MFPKTRNINAVLFSVTQFTVIRTGVGQNSTNILKNQLNTFEYDVCPPFAAITASILRGIDSYKLELFPNEFDSILQIKHPPVLVKTMAAEVDFLLEFLKLTISTQ